MRVFEWQTRVRNESDKAWEPQGAPPTDLDTKLIDLSKSISVGTRKMVNYA